MYPIGISKNIKLRKESSVSERSRIPINSYPNQETSGVQAEPCPNQKHPVSERSRIHINSYPNHETSGVQAEPCPNQKHPVSERSRGHVHYFPNINNSLQITSVM